jgi:peroxiredoxin
MKKALLFFVPLAAVALCVLAFSFQTGNSQDKGSKVPDTSFKAINKDGAINLSSLRGKVVFVNFFTTWCPSCKQEIPHLEGLYRKFKPKGVEVVGVSLDDKPAEKVLEFVQKMGISYPVGMPGKDSLTGFGMVTMIPTTFVLDTSGAIRERLVGPYPQEALEALATRILGGQAAKTS